jgi:site-specific DNA recombinase
MTGSSKTLLPRNGHTLVVGIVARISGCQNQKELSLDDQVDHGKETVKELYEGPVDYRVVATKGKGERLDRPELTELEAMLRRRELDLLVCEDIGRMVRGTVAAWLCGIAVDHGTRVIAPNDCIDTDDSSWEEDVISACRDHVGHNAHTSKRIKQKSMNRFVKFGGAPALPIYGYIKPPGAKTYDDWQMDDTAAPIFEEWFRRLLENPNCSALADWLNKQGVPTGKYCRLKKWDMPIWTVTFCVRGVS